VAGVSKAGVVSLAVGLLLMFAVWFLAFFKGEFMASLAALAFSAVAGGLFLFGLLLFLIGLLILAL